MRQKAITSSEGEHLQEISSGHHAVRSQPLNSSGCVDPLLRNGSNDQGHTACSCAPYGGYFTAASRENISDHFDPKRYDFRQAARLRIAMSCKLLISDQNA